MARPEPLADLVAALQRLPGIGARSAQRLAYYILKTPREEVDALAAAMLLLTCEIAAAYLFYICSNHAFIDGNKRTALAACLVFLATNELLPKEKLPIDEWEALVLDVASRIDRDQTTARLRVLLKQLARKKE